MPEIRLGVHKFTIEQQFSSTVFVPVSEGELTWELLLPDLIDAASDLSSVTAILEGRRKGVKVAQLVLKWEHQMTSFTMIFVRKDTFTSVRVFSIVRPITPVVIRSGTGFQYFIVDRVNGKVLGHDDDDLGDVHVKPAQTVIDELVALAPALTALTKHREIILKGSSGDAAKSKCENDRKSGWVTVVAATAAAALTVSTAGMGGVAIALVGAAIGAAGGAQAAKTENEYTECKDKAEKDKGDTKD